MSRKTPPAHPVISQRERSEEFSQEFVGMDSNLRRGFHSEQNEKACAADLSHRKTARFPEPPQAPAGCGGGKWRNPSWPTITFQTLPIALATPPPPVLTH